MNQRIALKTALRNTYILKELFVIYLSADMMFAFTLSENGAFCCDEVANNIFALLFIKQYIYFFFKAFLTRDLVNYPGRTSKRA